MIFFFFLELCLVVGISGSNTGISVSLCRLIITAFHTLGHIGATGARIKLYRSGVINGTGKALSDDYSPKRTARQFHRLLDLDFFEFEKCLLFYNSVFYFLTFLKINS